jgi:5'-3' exonuclease
MRQQGVITQDTATYSHLQGILNLRLLRTPQNFKRNNKHGGYSLQGCDAVYYGVCSQNPAACVVKVDKISQNKDSPLILF